MKKFLPWIIGAIIVLLLAMRLFYRRINRLHNEAAWYVSELRYDFSAKVDSVPKPGRALISITGGEFDSRREHKLQRELKFHGMIRLLVPRGDRFDIIIRGKCLKNDSLCINSAMTALRFSGIRN